MPPAAADMLRYFERYDIFIDCQDVFAMMPRRRYFIHFLFTPFAMRAAFADGRHAAIIALMPSHAAAMPATIAAMPLLRYEIDAAARCLIFAARAPLLPRRRVYTLMMPPLLLNTYVTRSVVYLLLYMPTAPLILMLAFADD